MLNGFEDGGVAYVMLIRTRYALDHDIHEAMIRRRSLLRLIIQQSIEDGIFIQPGKTHPDVFSLSIQQGGNRAIADNRKVHLRHCFSAFS
jgi:hypothetical protein